MVAGAVVAAGAAPAADRDWLTGDGRWADGVNWTTGTPPNSGTTALIGNPNGGVPYTVTVDTAGQAASALSITASAATLDVTSGGLTIGAGGLSATAGTVRVSGGTLTLNGASSTSAGTALAITGGRLTANAALSVGGAFTFDSFATLGGSNAVTVAGPAALAPTAGFSVSLADSVVLALDGASTLGAGSGTASSVFVGDTATLRVGAGGTLTAAVAADQTASVFGGSSGATFSVQGTLAKQGAGTLAISGLNANIPGAVTVSGGTLQLADSANLAQFNAGTNTLTGGTYTVNGATLDFGGRTISTLGAGTTVTLNGPAATFTALNGLTQNNGTVSVTGGKTFTPTAAAVANAGTLAVGTGSTFGKAVTTSSGGLLTGAGTVTGAVTAQTGSTVRPGDGATIGTLTAPSLTFENNSMLAVLAGSSSNAQLALNGGTPLAASALSDVLIVQLTDDGTLDLSGNTTYTRTLITSANSLTATGLTPANFMATATNFSFASMPVFMLSASALTIQFTPVPEPAAVLAVAGLGLAAARRWRRVGLTRGPEMSKA